MPRGSKSLQLGPPLWRGLGALGHEVRLMPPAYLELCVKRGKTEAADAETIVEAVARPISRSRP